MIGGALVSVFIMPPSLAELERRLRGRNEDSDGVVARRLGVARDEMGQWRRFRYVLVSGTMDEDLEAMQRVLAVERMRTDRIRSLTVA